MSTPFASLPLHRRDPGPRVGGAEADAVLDQLEASIRAREAQRAGQPITITSGELQAMMMRWGTRPYHPLLFDERYMLPTRAWFLGPFAEAVMANTRALGLDFYRANVNDCDKFARRMLVWAEDCHARTSPDCEAGLAVGAFIYQPDTSQGDLHAICCAIVHEGEFSLVFVEPQNGRELVLSPDEIRSANGYLF